MVLGVVVAPGHVRDVTSAVVSQLGEDLQRAYPAVEWTTTLEVERLVSPPAPATDLMDAARRTLLARSWDLAIVVTDLPLRRAGRPVVRRASPTHGVALVSLPALGVLLLRTRLRQTLLDLVADLVGEAPAAPARGRLDSLRRHWAARALRERAIDVPDGSPGRSLSFAGRLVAGNLRLLLGMIHANRPWRFASRLYGALIAALAAGAYGLVTSDVWRISAALSTLRLSVVGLVAITVTIAAVIASHGLWERAPDPEVREQVALFNLVTALTITLGIAFLYGALFLLNVAISLLVVEPEVLGRSLGHDAGARDYAAVAWFVTSLATVAGALGATLESDEAVREAAYAVSASDD